MFRLVATFCSLMLFSQLTYADVYLEIGDSITKGGETIYCGASGSGPLQSATEKICQSYYTNGQCISYNEKTITGRYCAEGSVCQKYYTNGQCISADTTAECGNNGCSVSKECQKYYSNGQCITYDTVVSCY